MIRERLSFVATSDLAGIMRGKAFPTADLQRRLIRGVGWTPTNVQITCFNVIADSPFGALGDLLLVPDPDSGFEIDWDEEAREHLLLGDIVTLDGAPWDFCTRGILKASLDRLKRVAGVELRSAFEHEFQLNGDRAGSELGYSLEAFRSAHALAEELMGALIQAGLTPDTFMKEYGTNQYEVTLGPELGLRAADAAVLLREVTRLIAARADLRATFTPIRDVGSVGNGVHIHLSFTGQDGPLTYDPKGPGGMSRVAAAFSGGVLKYLDAILCFTAPSAISYQRLTPHRWSAAYNNLGLRDREAALRICPVTAIDPLAVAAQFNLEYRAADAAASPYLALAAIVHAGCQGIEEGLPAPPVTEEDLSVLTEHELAARGLFRLPQSLSEALDRLEKNAVVRGWFAPDFAPVYIAHKKAEIAHLDGKDIAAQCAAYEAVY